MRIIAGAYKGHPLKAPSGNTTRPTTDRVKESFMNALEVARGGLQDALVLDAFAGSGSLGLEALSRGASLCEFYEIDRSVLPILDHNIKQLGIAHEKYRVTKRNVLKSPPTNKPFDLIMLDPPYKVEAHTILQFLEKLDQNKALAPDAFIVYEHSSAQSLPLPSGTSALQWTIVFQKKYGDSAVDIFRIHKCSQERLDEE